MSDPIPSLLAEPIRTPRGLHLAADGSDPYETFAAYFYRLEVEAVNRGIDFELEVFADILLAVYAIFEPMEVPPKLTFELIQAHPNFKEVATPSWVSAWLSAVALACIEKSITVLKASTPPAELRAGQSALWMAEANLFSGMAGMTVNGSTEAFMNRAVNARQAVFSRKDKPRNLDREAATIMQIAKKTAKAVTTEAMRDFRKNGYTRRQFLETAMAGGVDGLEITKINGDYEISHNDIVGNKLPKLSPAMIKRCWEAAGGK